MSGKFFLRRPTPPRANISGKKFLDALLYTTSAPQSLAPQLLEASYAPVPRASQWCHWCIMVILRDVTFSFDARLAAGKFVSDCSAANKCVRNKENVSIF
jgi:hypothetical protein